ncbi:chymotrypsin-2-like isoform X2 [Sitodiplosis mosellana]|uniref:chymotrypsin-2-like isoform X2 n=1 Tax=Sitodiplosis mosellana TaxID=263140 RepID=UPI002443D253|nr:chymotrypsin-2-like isoform X2 [Sitodiplosis mosellana]
MKLIPCALVFCILFVIQVECILQGERTSITNHPYLVSIRDNKTKIHMAGGSIISSRLILTSSFMLDGYDDPKFISVLAGTSDLSAGGTNIKIEQIIKYKYDHADIALLRTTKDIIFTDSIQPIEIPAINFGNSDANAIVAGWGKTKSDTADYTSELGMANYSLLDNFNCKLRLKEADPEWTPIINEKKLCTVQNLPTTGICKGDLGSPLVLPTSGSKHLLIGIASWFHWKKSPCSNGYPNVYSNVYAYRDWIAKGDGNAIRATSFVLIALVVTLLSIF